VDWERFADDFAARLAAAFALAAEPTPWPDFNEEEVSGLIEQYASPEWLEYR
jgi:lipoate-protein ligase A